MNSNNTDSFYKSKPFAVKFHSGLTSERDAVTAQDLNDMLSDSVDANGHKLATSLTTTIDSTVKMPCYVKPNDGSRRDSDEHDEKCGRDYAGSSSEERVRSLKLARGCHQTKCRYIEAGIS